MSHCTCKLTFITKPSIISVKMAKTFDDFVQIKYEVSRKDVGLLFMIKWKNNEIDNLSLALQVAYVGAQVMFSEIKDNIQDLFSAIEDQKKTETKMDIPKLISTILPLAEKANTELEKHFYEKHPDLKDGLNISFDGGYIHASKELKRVKTIYLEVTTLAAMDCFKKGIKHADSRLNPKAKSAHDNDEADGAEQFDMVRKQINDVINESISAAFTDLNVSRVTYTQGYLEELVELFVCSIKGTYIIMKHTVVLCRHRLLKLLD